MSSSQIVVADPTFSYTTQTEFDIIIVGAGMIGLTLAIGLAKSGFNIAVVEKSELSTIDPTTHTIPDIRISSLSLGTINFLKNLGIWDKLTQHRVTTYTGLRTWDTSFPAVNFNAAQLNVDYLGAMVENSILQHTLANIAKAFVNIRFFTGATVISNHFDSVTQLNKLQFTDIENQSKAIYSRLIIGSDGAHSIVRQLAFIGSSSWEYSQSCMLVTIKTDIQNKNETWQQFTSDGPRAFLPLHDNWASLVWYDNKSKIKNLAMLSNEALKIAVSNHFPNIIGEIEVIDKAYFPLTRMHANQYFKSGVLLVGDAAHTINPLAGQGANLGFKDVEMLIKLMTDARDNGTTWYCDSLLMQYEKYRRKDNLLMQTGMDMLYHGFNSTALPLKIIRNLIFLTVEKHNFLKSWILKYAIGLNSQ